MYEYNLFHQGIEVLSSIPSPDSESILTVKLMCSLFAIFDFLTEQSVRQASREQTSRARKGDQRK